MSLARTNTALEFAVQYLEDGEGKTGLTVTVNVYRGATQIETEESAEEIGDGLYRYVLADTETGTAGCYYAVFSTAGDVDQKDLATMYLVGGWVDLIDASIDSRLATAGYTPPDNAGIAAIEAKTNALPAFPAATGDIPSTSTIAAAVWSAETRTLTSAGAGGATAQEVWEYGTRTLSGGEGSWVIP